MALQDLVDDARAWYGSAGALALLGRDGRDWFARSGAADLDGSPLDRDARFRIASITKPIVGLLVVDAVERGEVGLDDVVGDILPGVLRAEPRVTVRQLLDHTSGIFDEGNEGDPIADIDRLPDDLRREAEVLVERYRAGEAVILPAGILIALAETHDRYNVPGLGSHYSNVNYQVAAMVLETATGEPLSELLAERIAAPLGLRRTTIAPPDLGSPEMRGYLEGSAAGSVRDVTDDLVAFGNGGNGGIVSTADELLTMLQALAAGELVTPELRTEQVTPFLMDYGLGVATYRLSCGTFLGHGGSVNGTVSIAMVSPDGRDGVVLAFNLRSDARPLDLTSLAERALCGG